MCNCKNCVWGILVEECEFPELAIYECMQEWSELECQFTPYNLEDEPAMIANDSLDDDIEDIAEDEYEHLDVSEDISQEDLEEWMYPYGKPPLY